VESVTAEVADAQLRLLELGDSVLDARAVFLERGDG
jgi:hypothetical protein